MVYDAELGDALRQNPDKAKQTLDILNNLFQQVGRPAAESVTDALEQLRSMPMEDRGKLLEKFGNGRIAEALAYLNEKTLFRDDRSRLPRCSAWRRYNLSLFW